MRPWLYYCLFGLLSVSGLRLGEARNLKVQDVDLDAALLTVRVAKFVRTRLVPLHNSTCEVLAHYIARRQRHWEGRPVSSYLFVSSKENQLDGGDIHRTFYALSRQIGLRGAGDSHGPRLHEMRHYSGIIRLSSAAGDVANVMEKAMPIEPFLPGSHCRDGQDHAGQVATCSISPR